MIEAACLRLEVAPDPMLPMSVQSRRDRIWQWQRRPGARTRLRINPQGFRTEDDIDAASKVREHLDYLRRMATEGVVTPGLATKARAVWRVAQVLVGGGLPVPAAAAFSGGPVEYHWSVGPHQLSAEIPSEGLCHWTYRNINSGELWGLEAATNDELPPRLIRALTRIVTSSR